MYAQKSLGWLNISLKMASVKIKMKPSMDCILAVIFMDGSTVRYLLQLKHFLKKTLDKFTELCYTVYVIKRAGALKKGEKNHDES